MLPWFLLAALSTMTPGQPALPDTTPLLCISDHTVGFRYQRDLGTWDEQAFSAGTKYLLRPLRENDFQQYPDELDTTPRPTWGFFSFGDDDPLGTCTLAGDDFDCSSNVGYIIHANRAALRFSVASTGNYVDQGDALLHDKDSDSAKSPRDDFFEIGTCTLLPLPK